jgi:pimeloyl-ACP methyl ester carboxylesterase
MTDTPTPNYTLLDEAGLGGAMFFPRPNESPPPNGATDHLIEVDSNSTPRVAIAARHYLADPIWPTILYFHGNGEVASDHDGIAPLYRNIGINLFVAEFRGYGDSAGTPSYATLVSDAHPVVAAFHSILDQLGCAAQRYVMGRSLGANPALEAAANAAQRFNGLIIESGAGNIRLFLARTGLLDTEIGVQLAHAHEPKIRSITLPTIIIHAEIDLLVPPSTAEGLRDLLINTTAVLEVIPRAGHNDLLWVGRVQYLEAINQLVQQSAHPA